MILILAGEKIKLILIMPLFEWATQWEHPSRKGATWHLLNISTLTLLGDLRRAVHNYMYLSSLLVLACFPHSRKTPVPAFTIYYKV